MCDADEPAEILLSIHGSSGSRGHILLRLQSNHRDYPSNRLGTRLRSKHRIHRPHHRIHSRDTVWNRLGQTLEEKPPSYPRTIRDIPRDTRTTRDVLWAKGAPRRTLVAAPLEALASRKPVSSHVNRQDSVPVSTAMPSCLLQELERRG